MSTHHSAGGCGDDIVNRRRMRLLQRRRVYLVVFGDGSVDAKNDWLGLAGQIRSTEGSAPPFDTRLRNVNNLLGLDRSAHLVISRNFSRRLRAPKLCKRAELADAHG